MFTFRRRRRRFPRLTWRMLLVFVLAAVAYYYFWQFFLTSPLVFPPKPSAVVREYLRGLGDEKGLADKKLVSLHAAADLALRGGPRAPWAGRVTGWEILEEKIEGGEARVTVNLLFNAPKSPVTKILRMIYLLRHEDGRWLIADVH